MTFWPYRIRELGDEIASLSLEEVQKLGKYLQEQHGIQPLIVVASTIGESAAGAGGSAGSELWLEDYGNKKIAVIKAIRQITGLGLKEAKQMSESAPICVIGPSDATSLGDGRELLEKAGAKVSIR